ncbi:MAG: PHP domain-containing protein [Spirochaetaceae bacterium]|nr:PHP domain-containing protein [Spirochaetaceae bacterium]
MIDLHTHSTASDGTLTPTELVALAAAQGVTALALTDHDTVAGLGEAREEADKQGLTLIPGIELTIDWKNGDFHLLGLGIRDESALRRVIVQKQGEREIRNQGIIEKMNIDGIPVTLEDIRASAHTSSIGRPHFADYLVTHRLARSRSQAFTKFLGKNAPWYVPHGGLSMADAVAAILASGAQPVLAHPLSLYVSWGRMEEVLADFRAAGITGLEVWHPSASAADGSRLEKLAEKLGFFITAGSDFHGLPCHDRPAKETRCECPLGHSAPGRPIHYPLPTLR